MFSLLLPPKGGGDRSAEIPRQDRRVFLWGKGVSMAYQELATQRALDGENYSRKINNDFYEGDFGESKATLLERDVNQRLGEMSKGDRADLYTLTVGNAQVKGLMLLDAPIPMIPVPIFFDREKTADKANKIEKVHNALIKIEELAFSENPVGKQILQTVTEGMSTPEKELLLRTETPLPSTIRRRNTRFDTFYNTDTNDMAIIEANTTNPEGMLYHLILQETGRDFMQALGYDPKEFDQTKDSAAHQVIRMFQEEYEERKGEPLKTLGVVYEPTDEASVVNQSEIPRLKEFFQSFSIDLHIGAPTEVETEDDQVVINGEPVDAIWRNAVDLEKALKNAPGFIDVLAHPSTYVVLNDDRGRFMGSKHLLAELHDPKVQKAAGFTDEEIAAIKEIVPFTFNPADVEALEGPGGETLTAKEYLMQFRKEFILKPSSGTHGEELNFGVNNKDWEKTVDTAITQGGFVAQRYIPYNSITRPITSITAEGDLVTANYVQDTNIHVIGGKALGTSICRASLATKGEIKVLNVAAGGGLQPSLLV